MRLHPFRDAVGRVMAEPQRYIDGTGQTDAEQREAQRKQNQAAIDLVGGWMTDESGYDEETWPSLRAALNANRKKVGARLLFDDD